MTPCPACGTEVTETVWVAWGKFYCSEDCARQASKKPPE